MTLLNVQLLHLYTLYRWLYENCLMTFPWIRNFPSPCAFILPSCCLLEKWDDSKQERCPSEQGASQETKAYPSSLPGSVNFLIGIWLWKNSNAHACVWLSLKQISSTSSPYRPLPPWIKGRVSSTAAPVLLQAPPSFLAFEPSSVRLLPKLVGARTHQGHLSPALSSHRLVQACSIHNFCHFSSTMCIYMHICTQTLALPLVFLH